MIRFTRDYVLNGITEQDFNAWKHHPVTKLYLRWLRDYERILSERQIGILRGSSQTPDPYALGIFNGQINTIAEVAEPQFQSIADFYPDEDKQTEEEHAA